MELVEIRDAADIRLAAVSAIYVQAIPASERKSTSWFKAAPARKDYRLIVATEEDLPVGFALLFVPPEESFVLLEYLAVSPAERGRGRGGELFDRGVADSKPRAVLVEVEEPFAGDPEKHRRQAFYRRRGCRRVSGMIYQLPLQTIPPPPRMELFIACAPRPLKRELLSRWLTRIYTEVYGQPAGDPRLQAMLAPVPDSVQFD